MKTAARVLPTRDAISKEMAFLFVLNMQQLLEKKEPNLNAAAALATLFYGPPTVCKKAVLCTLY